MRMCSEFTICVLIFVWFAGHKKELDCATLSFYRKTIGRKERPSQFPQLPASCLYLHLSDKMIILLGVCTDKQGVKHYISCDSAPTVLEKSASNCSGERKTIAINALLNSYNVTMPLIEYSILISLPRILDKNFSSNPL